MEDERVSNLEVPTGHLKGIKFEILSRSEIKLFSSMVVSESSHVSDASLGLPNLSSCCLTCGASSVKDCEGHYGYVELPADICNPHFISELVLILNKICPGCKSLKSRKKAKISAAEKLMKGELSDASIGCKFCSREYPPMKFRHIKRSFEIKAVVDAEKFYGKDLTQQLPKDYWDFVPKYLQQLSSSFEMILLPEQVFTLVKNIPSSLVERVCGKKEFLFLSRLPITSNSSRVVEMVPTQLEGHSLMFDDRTTTYRKLVGMNRYIDMLGPPVRLDDLVPNLVCRRVKDCLNASKLFAKKNLSTTKDGATESGLRWVKEVILGKRTDNSFRMVVVGDPKIRLEEIGLPQRILNSLAVPEHVNRFNFEKILNYGRNSRLFKKKEEPGRGSSFMFKKMRELELGDLVYRPLEDGDLVLVNRPPTVHQHSTIALSVKALPNDSVASINPLCCAPFLGDFDGDCLGGFVPQSVGCRVELMELSSLDKQLINGQDGRNLLSLSHDGLTAAHFLTGTDVFLNKFEMQQLALLTPRLVGYPAIIKAPLTKTPLWTGKQLFSLLLPESLDFTFGASDVIIKKGDLLNVSPESTWLRKSEDNVFLCLLKENPAKFLDYLFAVQDVHCEWLTMKGFSVSLSDIHLSSDFSERKKCIDEVSLALQDVDNGIRTRALISDTSNEFLLTQADWMGRLLHDYASDYTACSKPLSINEIEGAYNDIAPELNNLVSPYSSKENTMMKMIKSGSKGSFLKLVQQSLCLGFQHASGFVRSKIPQKVSFHLTEHKSISDLRQKEVDCGLVCNSFLDGLHPSEYFLHARSNRGTMYSDNAELPGTLSRKLMFYLRDLCLSYDATVRNTYGNQLVQFSYGFSENEGVADSTNGGKRCAGLPVGALAASAISEALYGALDQPSSLKVSPLKNLEKALTGGSKSKTGSQPVVIYLCRQLSELRYGYEYGASKVKSHLERVILTDIVLTVVINRVFEPGASDMDVSQWVTHFCVCKERMNKRRLTLNNLIDGLNREFNTGKKMKKFFLPNLFFNNGCSSHPCGLRHDHNELIMTTEECGFTCFEIQNDLIPFVLETVIRGSPLVKKVEILSKDPYKPTKGRWHASDELCLMVHSVDNCSRAKFWGALQDACLPVMPFIDWHRSHPIGVHTMHSSYGIGAASQFFLVDLDMAISEVRTVRKDHLFLTMNCLSVTGEFHGLSVRGIRQQRQQMSISSVFLQSCFSGPIHQFIRAAKDGVADDLLGSIDALSWGKEAPIGTGGPFSIIFSPKGQNLVEPGGNVYDILSAAESLNKNTSSQELSCLQSIEALEKNIRNMLAGYQINEYLNKNDKATVLSVLRFHPYEKDKVGCGVRAVKVAFHPDFPSSRCFMIVRNDGTEEDFSYRKCLDGALEKLNSNTNGSGRSKADWGMWP